MGPWRTYCLHFFTYCDLKITLVGIPSDLTDKEGLISPMISSWESERLFLWDHLTEGLTIDTLCSLPGPFTPLVMWFPESRMFAAFEANFTSDSLTFSPDL